MPTARFNERFMPQKPTIYLDTTIISAYWHASVDPLLTSRHLLTREWWNTERQNFSVYASRVTESELAAGTFSRQNDCLKMVRRLRFLTINEAVANFAQSLLDRRIVPSSKQGDALQMAIAVAHRVDYLLTWNYAHLANPDAQERLILLCRDLDLPAPAMVSPETIPKVNLGQIIRRKPR
jgi:hypothetical protein